MAKATELRKIIAEALGTVGGKRVAKKPFRYDVPPKVLAGSYALGTAGALYAATPRGRKKK